MIALMAGAAAYNRAFDQERLQRAHEHYLLGRTLADYGYYDRAIDEFSDALIYQRDNFDYRLGLSLALFHDKRYTEAEYQLLELRSQEPTDATANRLLARLAARAGRYSQAANFYRTAIYGRWPRNPEQNRLATRFELVDLLQRHGGPSQAVGEYLAIWQEEPHTNALARRVGLGLLDSGAPREALGILSLIEDGNDAEVLEAIGRAHMQIGDYPLAYVYLQRADRARPGDDSLHDDIELIQRVLELDPRRRGLSSAERQRRSRAALERVYEYIGACANPLGAKLQGPPEPQPQAVRDLLATAGERLRPGRRVTDVAADTEANLLLASNLWSLREQVCHGVWDEDDVLLRVMRNLDR